jgi:hypothetical protein
MGIDVIQPNDNVNGKDLKTFIKEYWQALCPLPKSSNPAWENTGSKDKSFNDSVSADLYLLSFSRKPQTTVTRTIHVPSDKGLFIPIMSVIVTEFEKPQETPQRLIAIANKDQSSIDSNSLTLELDGDPLNALDSYKSNPAAVGTFQVNFPSDDIFNFASPGSYDAFAGGRYVWTKPLSQGDHTVRFKGNLNCSPPVDCVDAVYKEDITYKITVP